MIIGTAALFVLNSSIDKKLESRTKFNSGFVSCLDTAINLIQYQNSDFYNYAKSDSTSVQYPTKSDFETVWCQYFATINNSGLSLSTSYVDASISYDVYLYEEKIGHILALSPASETDDNYGKITGISSKFNMNYMSSLNLNENIYGTMTMALLPITAFTNALHSAVPSIDVSDCASSLTLSQTKSTNAYYYYTGSLYSEDFVAIYTMKNNQSIVLACCGKDLTSMVEKIMQEIS